MTLHYESAARLLRRLQAREVSAVELVEWTIRRIEQFDGEINAVVVRDFDRARQQAQQSDAWRASGKPCGPLHGLPMTVKESFQVQGLPTTFGHPSMRQHVAREDAVTVERFRAAGAIVLGKTNVPVSLADWQTFNPVYGTTCNPWDRTRTPGGSSGGSAAALAAGFSALELGSDIGASIRNPSHYCGVWGAQTHLGHGDTRGSHAHSQSLCGDRHLRGRAHGAKCPRPVAGDDGAGSAIDSLDALGARADLLGRLWPIAPRMSSRFHL